MKLLKKNILLLLLLFMMLLCGCKSQSAFSSIDGTDKLLVHFIDVGQGDAILIQVNSKNMLIDSGPADSKNDLLNYIKKLNITSFDYVIATHPHEDHIGNMSTIINNFNVHKFYAPKIAHASTSFVKLINSLSKSNLKINVIKRGINSIDLGDNCSITVLSPIKEDYGDDINSYSAVFKITYGTTSFLFTGDSTIENETAFLSNEDDLTADVLKIAHHGSNTSTCADFLSAVNPSLAIISVGSNNKFNHPCSRVISSLEEHNIPILRTDKNGTIIISSDGTSLTTYTEN